MKHLFATALLAAVAFLGFSQSSQASGGLFRRCGGCDSGCAQSAPCAPSAPAPVQYENRKVVKYRSKMVEKEIDVLECQRVTREVPYTYTVCVPVTKQEKRKVIVCTPVSKQVEYTYTVMVPHTVQKKVQCTNYTCERVMITEKVPVCRTVCVTCVDECGRCYTRRERVTVMEEQTRCVIKRTPVVTEQLVNVVVCTPEARKGVKTVCDIVRNEREEMVNVCSFDYQKRQGIRTVCEYVTVKSKRKVMTCVTESYEETVKVAICPPSSCNSCNECGHSHRVGFFRRGGCN